MNVHLLEGWARLTVGDVAQDRADSCMYSFTYERPHITALYVGLC